MCGLVSITVVGRPSSCAFLPAAFIYLQFAQAVELKVNRDSVNRFSRAVALSIEARIASLVISKTEIFKNILAAAGRVRWVPIITLPVIQLHCTVRRIVILLMCLR